MALLTEMVKIKMNSRTRKIYSELGYDTNDDYIDIQVSKLPLKSNVKVKIMCDYCGKIYEQSYGDYLKSIKHINKTSCCECKYKKIKEVSIFKYGVDNISKLEYVKSKKVDTCRKNLGCDYPMQNKSVMKHSKQTMIEKYGVEHNLHREEIKEVIKYANANEKYKNRSAPCSKAQRYLCDLYGGTLNYPVDWYNLDILLYDKIYIEYNGSGHDMNVRMGQITKENFDKKELIRYNYIKSKGYKEIIFDNYSDKLPNDDILIDIKNKCIKYLQINSNSNWIRVNLDNGKITTKDAEIFYMIN